MPKRTSMTVVPAYIARTQLGSLLKQVGERKFRFLITKSGKPTAMLLGATDFDDILEELDPDSGRAAGPLPRSTGRATR